MPIGIVEVPIGTFSNFVQLLFFTRFGLFFGRFSELEVVLRHNLYLYS